MSSTVHTAHSAVKWSACLGIHVCCSLPFDPTPFPAGTAYHQHGKPSVHSLNTRCQSSYKIHLA